MLPTLLALALLGTAEASDHDAAEASDLLALGIPSAPIPAVDRTGPAVGHASRGGSRSSGSRSSGSRSSGSRSSGSRSSGSRSSGSRGASPSRSSGSAPSGSRAPARAPGGASAPSRSGPGPSSARPSSSGSNRSPASTGSRPSSSRGTPARPPSSSGPSRSGPARVPSSSSPPRAAPSRGTPAGQRAPARPNSSYSRPGATTSRTAPGRVVQGRTVQRPQVGSRPNGSLRSSTTSRPTGRPLHRSNDVRYSRPSYRSVRSYPRAHYGAPRVYTYRPYYSRWWCHPYYRYSYATVAVVGFGFSVWAWDAGWVPPYRRGWGWNPGYWGWGYWNPGYWTPMVAAPVDYVYVNGWWEGDAYVEGYYRSEARDDWEWIDGYYLDDGTYVRGHWSPTTPAPEGYLWEPGFWDGETYVDGFYRPQFRKGFYWVGAWYDTEGIFNSGYWQPEVEEPGSVWIPGWFDGNEWVPGYWEDEQTYMNTDLDAWQPEEGVDDGWEEGVVLDDEGQVYDDGSGPPTARLIQRMEARDGVAPLAVPVVIPDDVE